MKAMKLIGLGLAFALMGAGAQAQGNYPNKPV